MSGARLQVPERAPLDAEESLLAPIPPRCRMWDAAREGAEGVLLEWPSGFSSARRPFLPHAQGLPPQAAIPPVVGFAARFSRGRTDAFFRTGKGRPVRRGGCRGNASVSCPPDLHGDLPPSLPSSSRECGASARRSAPFQETVRPGALSPLYCSEPHIVIRRVEFSAERATI